MSIFIDVIQGTYAYLLIILTLIVTGLMLALIMLMMKRTKEAGANPEFAEPAKAAEAAAVVPPSKELEELRQKLADAEAENKKGQVQAEEVQVLRDKVKYLESKLLEYEILQEEIGTLSALKLENEHLKQEISSLKKPQGAANAAAAAPPAAEAAPAPAPVAALEPEPPSPEPQIAAAMDAMAPKDEVADSKEPVAGVFFPPQGPAAEANAVVEETEASLEGLLTQIDDLAEDAKGQKA